MRKILYFLLFLCISCGHNHKLTQNKDLENKVENFQRDKYEIVESDTFYFTYTYIGDSVYYSPKSDKYVITFYNGSRGSFCVDFTPPATIEQRIQDSIEIKNFLKEKMDEQIDYN